MNKRKIFKVIISILLLFNSAGALYGGSELIFNPDGSSLQLPLKLLEHTPFQDYFIPGIILFVANGLFGIYVFTMLILNTRHHSLLVIAQGAILLGWIIIQILLIQIIYYLHIILGLTGLILMTLGWMQTKYVSPKM